MIRVADYIVKRLLEHGIEHVFMISGGGAMHLNDAFGRMLYVCNHHEQACAIAAEGYFRASGKVAAVNVTTGPGGTNTLTGVLGQWTDSVPAVYIAGQVKFETTALSCKEIGLRQLGDQEITMEDIVRPIVKFAATVLDPLRIKYYVDKAVYVATHGRPGPVWLDVPMNVQGALVEETKLEEYDKKEDEIILDHDKLKSQVQQLAKWLVASERPVLVAGWGIRIAGAVKEFYNLIEKYKIPVLSTFNGFDLLPTNHPQHVGVIGTIGSRAGNFALQNSDLMLSVGSRNNIRQVSFNWKVFARAAKKVVVDIDPAELKKPTVIPDLPIAADAKEFLEILEKELAGIKLPNWQGWNEWCQERKRRYPIVLPENSDDIGGVDLYYFMHTLSEVLPEGSVTVAGDGSACVGMFQAGVVKKGQRFFWNSGCAAMGYDLPAAIGACFSLGKKDVVCLAGDGSLQLNIQELQTVIHHKLPIKLFYLNNNGYLSIKQTQDSYFAGHRVACDPQSGVSFPDIQKVAQAYGLPTTELSSHENFAENIREVLEMSGPVLCEVKLKTDYKFSPKLSSLKLPDGKMISKPLEDLYPFLDRKEFESNMLIPPLKE